MSRYVDYEDERQRAAPASPAPKPKARARGPATRRSGKQVRTVVATGLSACGGHSSLIAFGAEDFARYVGITSKTGRAGAAFRKAASRGLVDPLSLESVTAFRERRGARGLRCQAFAGGRPVAAVTVLRITPTKGQVTAAVSRVRAIEGRRWQGREVELAVPLGGQVVTFTGRLTKTTFEGA